MRVAGQRLLQVIPSPSDGYSVTYLKEVLRQAKVYIRPMQKDLSLIPCDAPTDVCSLLLLLSFFATMLALIHYLNISCLMIAFVLQG